MKKFFLLFLTLFLSMSMFTTNVSAKDTSSFSDMLNDLFNENTQEVIVHMNGQNITDTFINQFRNSFENGNIEAIKNYAADNCVIFSLPDTIQERGISTGTYTTPINYVTFRGTSVFHGGPVTMTAILRFRITCTYDFNTGQITGGVRAPTVLLQDADGVADEFRVTNVTYSGSITNNGYTVRYTSISFIPYASGSLDDQGTWQNYNRYTWTTPISYTPYN